MGGGETENQPLAEAGSKVDGYGTDMPYSSTKGELPKQPTPSLCQRLYPTGFWPELKQLICISAPLIGQQLTMYLLGPVSIAFCGHLGKIELDAVALACSLLNMAGITVGVGLTAACDTLFSQVFGSKDKHKLGIVLQRSILILGLAVLPVLTIFINAEALFLLLGQDPYVAKMAGDYMLILIPALISFMLYIPLLKYIQNQNIITPTLVVGAIANVVNALLHYLFLYVWDFGLPGSAASQSIGYFLFFVLSLVYIIYTGLYKNTWKGWSTDCLQYWGQFFTLGVFGLMMLGIEIWSFESGIFLAGNIGKTELGAQSLVLQLEIILYMLPLGNGIAASIRVGQFLGSGDARSACTTARVAITFISCTGLLTGLMLLALKDQLPYLFTDEKDVIHTAAQIFPILGVYMVFDSIAGTCGGIMRGSGNQNIGAVIVAVGYAVALSIGIPLMYLTSLSVIGFWIGLAVAILAVAIVFLVIVFRTDWEKEALLAYQRIEYDANSEQQLLSLSDESGSFLSSISSTASSPDKLSLKSLLCWRALAVVILVAIFVFGVILREVIIELDEPWKYRDLLSKNNVTESFIYLHNSSYTKSM